MAGKLHVKSVKGGLRILRQRKPEAATIAAQDPEGVLTEEAIPLELVETRAGGDRVVVRASNDTVRDAFGTIITVEGLTEWIEGYRAHRTVNLQHNLDLRGIKGRPFVGVATRIDLRPQLEIEIRVTDPETLELLRDGKIRGASLEFLPLESGIEARMIEGKPVLVYHRLSRELEATGLALTDAPAVPGSNVLALRTSRGMPPNWAFAAIDPSVLNGEVTNPREIEGLRWFAHHDLQTRFVDEARLLLALRAVGRGEVEVPSAASLSREEVLSRAEAHLSRHVQHGIGLPGIGYARE